MNEGTRKAIVFLNGKGIFSSEQFEEKYDKIVDYLFEIYEKYEEEYDFDPEDYMVDIQEELDEELNIINLTPHTVNVGNDSFESAGLIRLEEKHEKYFRKGDISFTRIYYKLETNLPPIKENTVYIVSLLVAQSFPERKDFCFPSNIVRDEKGNIIGCETLSFV